ncbi:hypothetical protein BKA01_001923 [Pseudonocardia eucalypti]|uniref:hypothetical protein n=1 Tax=Pseudonocardia eucalypti TaxID=648755 RepID=UPI00160BB222|nr:hypothetical protein [Pseudonocardia eucalypti]
MSGGGDPIKEKVGIRNDRSTVIHSRGWQDVSARRLPGEISTHGMSMVAPGGVEDASEVIKFLRNAKELRTN